MSHARTVSLTILIALSFVSSLSADWLDDIGWTQLVAQHGASLETGMDIDVSQVEAPTGSGNYMPDASHAHFAGKTFVNGSNLSSGSSGHSTTVGRVFYGGSNSLSPDVSMITNYEANDYLNRVQALATNADPLAQPFQVQNHSWIGNVEDEDIPLAINLLQRLDFVANRDNVTFCVGTSNGDGTPIPQLMCHSYNSITVGRTGGVHGGSTSFTTINGAGRSKPEVVGPPNAIGGATSYVTGTVSSLATLLKEAGGGAGGNQTHATQNEVTKALILAGATKSEFPTWTRTPTQPLDIKFGAGEINALYSYNMLTGGEFDGTTATPGVSAGPMGWDFSDSISGPMYYEFDLPNGATNVSILLTWNLNVTDNNASPLVFSPSTSLANMSLELRDENGVVVESSDSAVDNLEHIYLTDLEPGTYTLEVDSDSSVEFGLAWRMHPRIVTESFVESGVILEGGLSELLSSDNQKLRVATGTSSQTIDFKTTSPVAEPVLLRFSIESSTRSSVTVVQRVFLFDYVAGEFVLFDTRNANVLGDGIVEIGFDPDEDVKRFVEPGTNCVEARVEYSKTGLARGIRGFVDHVFWTIL